jgi:hypothetical protein
MRRTLTLLSLVVLLALPACGDESSSSGSGDDVGDWGVAEGDTSADGGDATEVSPDVAADSDTALAQDTAPDVSLTDTVEPDPEVVDPLPDVVVDPDVPPGGDTTVDVPAEDEAWGGGILLYELQSEFLNLAGAGARFTAEAGDLTAGLEGATVWGPCAESVSDPDAPSVVEFGFDAGAITISGTNPAVTLTPVDEGADGTGYASGLAEDLETLLPAGGALLTMSGAGGADIGAFQLVVQVPEPVTMSSPETGLFKSVPTDQALTVTWNAGTGEAVLVTASPLDDAFQGAPGVGLICGAEGDPGSLIIPAEAMAAMKASGVSRVALAVTRLRFGSAEAGARPVTATVSRSTGGPLDLK